MLEIKNIKKTFKTQEVLKNINLSLTSGEIVGLIGENGAGKTTLMNIILGNIHPDQGSVFLKQNKNYVTSQKIMQSIGYLLDIEFYTNFSAIELINLLNLYENKYIDNKNKKEMLSFFNLPETKKIKEYSYGMKQRLRLLVALSQERDLLILDEPLLGLDISSINLMKRRLKEFVKQGGSVLLSSHQLSEIENIIDRYVILNNGEIKETFTGEIISFKIFTQIEDSFKSDKLLNLLRGINLKIDNDKINYTIWVKSKSDLNKVLKIMYSLDLEVNIEQINEINQMFLNKKGDENNAK